MRRLIAAALFLSGIARAQCAAFYAPAGVTTLYADDEGKTKVPGSPFDHAITVIPAVRLSLDAISVKISTSLGTEGGCTPDDWKTSRTGLLKAWIVWRPGALFKAWVKQAYLVPVQYSISGSFGVQTVAENISAIEHAVIEDIDRRAAESFKPPEVETSHIFPAEFDATWSALVETLSDQRWQVESIDRSSGLVTTKPAVDSRGDTMACATRLERDHKDWLNVFVKKAEGGTRVKVNATFHAIREDDVISCYSNGTLERELFAGISKNLQ